MKIEMWRTRKRAGYSRALSTLDSSPSLHWQCAKEEEASVTKQEDWSNNCKIWLEGVVEGEKKGWGRKPGICSDQPLFLSEEANVLGPNLASPSSSHLQCTKPTLDGLYPRRYEIRVVNPSKPYQILDEGGIALT